MDATSYPTKPLCQACPASPVDDPALITHFLNQTTFPGQKENLKNISDLPRIKLAFSGSG